MARNEAAGLTVEVVDDGTAGAARTTCILIIAVAQIRFCGRDLQLALTLLAGLLLLGLRFGLAGLLLLLVGLLLRFNLALLSLPF